MGRSPLPRVDDTIRFPPWVLPLIVLALSVPVIAGVAVAGLALGAAVAALLVGIVLMLAAKAKPREPFEIAPSPDGGRRVLLVATEALTPDAASEVARRTEGAEDVRVLVPTPSSRLDRWLATIKEPRAEAQRRVAESAGLLTAAGVPAGGSVGDNDPVQAVEDELRQYAADEVILYGIAAREPRTVRGLREKLRRPLSAIEADEGAAGVEVDLDAAEPR